MIYPRWAERNPVPQPVIAHLIQKNAFPQLYVSFLIIIIELHNSFEE